MVQKECFEADAYEQFKTETEQIIQDYQTGKFSTECSEIKVRIENVMRLTNGNPHAYLEICSLYKFLSALYNTAYIKAVIQFAEDLGFQFCFPQQTHAPVDMDSFATSVLQNKKTQDTFDINSYFVVSFCKEVEKPTGTMPYVCTFPLIVHSGSLLYSQLSVVKHTEILKGLSRLESLVRTKE